MPEIKIPFAGLYNSWLSQALDHAEEQSIDWHAEGERGEGSPDIVWPEDLQLSAFDIGGVWFYAMDYPKAHEMIAKAYLEEFDAWAGEALGETRPAWRKVFKRDADGLYRNMVSERYAADSCGFKFADMTSPREYNFTTDRLFATCSAAFIKRLWKRSKADEHKTLAALIRERFTSYDGFMSHYSNDLEQWPKTLADWDHNELETLLEACLDLAGADDSGFQMQMLESETFDTICDQAMDWDDLKSRMMDDRIEKLTAWAEDDPDAVAAWAAQNLDQWAKLTAHDADAVHALDLPVTDAMEFYYRCPETPDLFASA